MDRILAKNADRMKTLEERLHDAEDQAIQASRRVYIPLFNLLFFVLILIIFRLQNN